MFNKMKLIKILDAFSTQKYIATILECELEAHSKWS